MSRNYPGPAGGFSSSNPGRGGRNYRLVTTHLPMTEGLWAWDGAGRRWIRIEAGDDVTSIAVAYVGPTAPANPQIGWLWFQYDPTVDPNNGTLFVWTGSANGWVDPAKHPGGGTGTVTAISAGNGIMLTPNPITGTGSVALITPIPIASGGTGATTLTGAQANLGITPGGGGGTGTVTSISAGAGVTLTPNPITTSGTISFAGGAGVTSLTAGAGITLSPNPITGTGTISATGTGGAASVVPWDWPQGYNDPNQYTGRVLAAGFSGGLAIASGAGINFPPGYRVPNGSNGGALASGLATAGLPIRLELIHSGTGVLKYASNITCTVVNTSTTATGTIALALGTTASFPGGMPLYPYLGVSHADPNPRAFVIGPGQVMQITLLRLDVVDIALIPGISGWPTWTQSIDTGTPTSLLYPAICPTAVVTGAPLMVTDVMLYGVAC